MAERERALSDDEKIIDASPSKRFFIWMLTRDIGITDCILDLIDNPVDNVVEDFDIDVTDALMGKKAKRAPASAHIEIECSPDSFAITDSCGGISVKEAKEEVFKFGHPEEEREDRRDHGLSVYGVGMKRAFFKLGRMITMDSATQSEHFDLEFDVEKWARIKEWRLSFGRVADITKPDTKKPPGTKIEIKKLTKLAKRRFADPQFAEELRNRIATSHGLFIQSGIRITVNGKDARASIPEIVSSADVRPVRQTFSHDGVEIILIAGLTPKEDRVPRGWYVFCNGRMVIEADKTSLTGWGDKFPIHHSKYNHFCGFVYFRSEDVNALPWTTTKQGVERESEVYQTALDRMRIDARPVVDYLRDLYPGDVEDLVVEQRDLLKNARVVAVDELPAGNRSFKIRTPKKPDPLVTIRYKRTGVLIDKVRKKMGDRSISANRIGEETFDYYLEHEVE